MVGRAPLDVPICIGIGWAIIMYTARLLSDALRLPLLAAAALDTLLAINIDLSMDVVAYRLHMWHWNWTGTSLNLLTAQWFGIPYGNFIGWETVVLCYSGFSRLFERSLHRRTSTVLRAISVAALALLCSQLVLFSTETFLFPFMRDHLHISSRERFLGISVMLLAVTLWGWSKRHVPAHAISPLARWVPCWFHVFFVAAFFGFGFYRENRWMTAVARLNVAVGIVVHVLPWHSRLEVRGTALSTEDVTPGLSEGLEPML